MNSRENLDWRALQNVRQRLLKLEVKVSLENKDKL